MVMYFDFNVSDLQAATLTKALRISITYLLTLLIVRVRAITIR